MDHPLFGGYLPYLYAWLLLLSLWIGVITQLRIYTIVRHFRLHLLDELASGNDFLLRKDQAPEVARQIRERPDLGTTLSVYGSIATASGLPYGTALVVQYAAALVGSLVGFLLQ